MRLINYKRGYIEEFNCVIQGRIIMTRREYIKAINYLKRAKDWGYKFLLEEDLKRFILTKNGGSIVNLRVGPTEKLVKHFNIPNYKRGNYWIEVIN